MSQKYPICLLLLQLQKCKLFSEYHVETFVSFKAFKRHCHQITWHPILYATLPSLNISASVEWHVMWYLLYSSVHVLKTYVSVKNYFFSFTGQHFSFKVFHFIFLLLNLTSFKFMQTLAVKKSFENKFTVSDLIEDPELNLSFSPLYNNEEFWHLKTEQRN